MDRRLFLKLGAATAPLAALPSLGWSATGDDHRYLVLIELKGGNDGLNTVIPFADPLYYQLRPQLAVARDRVLRLSPKVGLHPSLEPLMEAWQAEQLAIVQGVGYPRPNRSHFRSIDIWETASDSQIVRQEGWLAEVCRELGQEDVSVEGVSLGRPGEGPLRGAAREIDLRQPRRFFRSTERLMKPLPRDRETDNPALSHILKTHDDVIQSARALESTLGKARATSQTFPGRMGRLFGLTAQLLVASAPIRVIRMTIPGFDTHANQLRVHERLLGQLAHNLASLRRELIDAGVWKRVLVMTYSEFGRRAAQNGSQGTDHGTAAPHFLVGGRVRGGLTGRSPSLRDLAGGDLRHSIDFRRLYATVARSWWGTAPSTLQAFSPLSLLGA